MIDYIRLVCDGDLSVLVATGTPLDKDLEMAKADVLAEFAELSGASESEGMMILNEIYSLRAQRASYLAAMMAMGELFDDGKEFFRSKGFDVSGWSAENPAKCLKRINAAIKAIDLKIGLKVKEYNKLAAKTEGKSIAEGDIRMEMAILSTDMSHTIGDDCNLATYASYKKSNKERAKALAAVMSKK